MIPNSLFFKFTQTALLLLFAMASQSAQAKHILIYGDSLSAAYGMELEQGWAHLLAQQWQGKHTVTNASISGETTQGGLQRLPLTLERLQPDVIVIELGANDGLRGAPISRIKSNLEKMIDLSKASGVMVVVAGISLPASYGPRYIDQFRALFADLAAEHEVGYLDLYREEFVGKPEYIQADGLHPTAITQPMIRDSVAEYFANSELLD